MFLKNKNIIFKIRRSKVTDYAALRAIFFVSSQYSKTCVQRPLSKRPQIGFQDQLSLNAGQKYCRMLPLEHSAILSTFNKLPFVIKIFILSLFEWPLYTGFIVLIVSLYTMIHCTTLGS